MAADNTLVQASFKEAISRAGADVPNQKPLYDSVNTIGKSVFDVANLFMTGYAKEKETQRIGKDKQMAGFQKQADELVAGLYAQDEPLPDAFIMAFRDKIISLQDEFEDYNTIGKGDTQENSMARARIMGELTRVKNQAINFRTKTQIFFESFEGVNTGEVDGKNIAAQKQALDFSNYERLVREGKIEVAYGEKGIEITSKKYGTRTIRVPLTNPSEQFVDASADNMMDVEEFLPDVIITLESLNKNFPPINEEHHAKILKDFNTILTQGTGDGKLGEKNYNEEVQLNRFVKHVSDPKNFKNVVSSSIEGISDISFKESLQSNLQIPVAILDNMFYDENGERVDAGLVFKGLDRVGDDNVIDEKDIADGRKSLEGDELKMFNQNVDDLIDALTNIDNKAFDINLSSKMLGEYLNQNTKKRYDYNYDLAVKAGNNSTKTYYVNKQYLDASQFAQGYGDTVKLINEPVEGMASHSNGFNFEYRDGQHYGQAEDGSFTVKLTPRQIATQTGLLHYTNTTAATLPPTEEEVPLITNDMDITNQDYEMTSEKNIINSKIAEVYKDYPGFQFLPGGRNELIIIAPDGKTKTSIRMDRTDPLGMGGNNAETQKAIQKFIIENQVKK